MAKCEKNMCDKELQTCPSCKGKGTTTNTFGATVHCSTCGDTGLVCPDHGRYWKR
jgi:hypothetical protein